MSRPSRLDFDLGFATRGTGRPSALTLDLGFGVRGFGRSVMDVPFGFAISAPEPDIYVFDRGDWQPAAQRAWTGSDWLPGTS